MNTASKMVAIILVNYNGSKDTIECIQSLQSLNYNNYTIIVVDNCSTDDSIEKLQKAQQLFEFKLLKSSKNNGFSAGNNIGINFARNELKADYYWLLNNDTLVEPDSLEELIRGFNYQKKVGITTARIYYNSNRKMIWYAGGNISHVTARTEHWHYGEINPQIDVNNYQDVSFASGCCMLISREAIDKVGLLDEGYFLYEEDSEYCLRLYEHGLKIIYCPKSIIYHKVSASTGQSSPISQYYTVRNKYRLIQQHYKGINKTIAYIYSTMQIQFRCLKRELDWKYYQEGKKAYIRGERGKTKCKF